jgi:hypothetical protein
MRTLIAAVLLALCSGGMVFAASQPPTPSSGNGVEQQDAKPAKYEIKPPPQQPGSENAPLFVRVVPTEPSEAEARHKQYEHHEKPTLDRWLTWGTVGLAVITAALSVFTFLLWKDASRTGKTTAIKMEASTAEAARAAAAMENTVAQSKVHTKLLEEFSQKQFRAYISADYIGATYQEGSLRFAGQLKLENTGFTPARKVSYWAKASIYREDPPTDYEFPEGQEFATDVGMSPRQSYVINGVDEKTYPDDVVFDVLMGKAKLYCWGLITYEDIFGGKWKTRFCHVYGFFYDSEGKVRWNCTYYRVHNDAT